MKEGLKIYDLRFKIFLILFILFVNHKSLFINHVYATVDSTPSADIKAKLEELKKEIASKAAKLKQEVNEKLQNKAYTGLVKDKSGTEITIIDKNGPKVIKTNQDTIYDNINIPKLKYSFKLVETDDNIAGLGEIDELGNLIAKKIVLLPEQPQQKNILWGKITSISDTKVSIRDRNFKNYDTSFSKVETGAKLNDFVIVTGYIDKNQLLQAGFVYIIPQGGVIRPKKNRLPDGQVATPSASPKPIPSIKPKTATPSAKKK